jgi:DNA-binding MarR family transcriptional regulator
MSSGDAPRWLTDDEQQTWRGFIAMTQLLFGALDRQLQAEAGLPHPHYVILAMLSEAPDRSMRMSRLAGVTSMSASRLSHAVTRLEERGWVSRHRSDSDRRGQVATLSDAGYRVLVEIAPLHVAEVRRRLFDQLTPAQVRQLGGIADAVLPGLLADDECAREAGLEAGER